MQMSADLVNLVELRKMIEYFNGVTVVENKNLTVVEAKPRSWKERLFSWPWKPWKKVNITMVPDRQVYYSKDNVVYCHPEVAKQLRMELRR